MRKEKMTTVETAQDAFDWGMENGVVLEVHQIMEAMDAGLTDKMDILDFCLGMPLEQLLAENA